MTNVGGDPAQMSGGAASLHASGSTLEQMRPSLSGSGSSISGGVGAPELSAAVGRFFTAWSALVGDTGTQLLSASQLAANAAQDLAVSGGQP